MGSDKAESSNGKCSGQASKAATTEFLIAWSDDQTGLLLQVASEAPQIVPFLLSGMPLRMPEKLNGEYQVEYSSSLDIGPDHAKHLVRNLQPEDIEYQPDSHRIAEFAEWLQRVGLTLDSIELPTGNVETRARVAKLMDGNLIVSFASELSPSNYALPQSDSKTQRSIPKAVPVGQETRVFLRQASYDEFPFLQTGRGTKLPIYAIEEVAFRKRFDEQPTH